MPFVPGLTHRCRVAEVMDQPDLAADRHAAALSGLARINLISGSATMVWRPIESLAPHHPGRKLRILDIATGGGDVPIALWRKAQRRGLALEIDGCDISPTALA